MKTKFLRASLITGIHSLPSDPLVLCSLAGDGSRVYLTQNIDEYQDAVTVREAVGIKYTSHLMQPITFAAALKHASEKRWSMAQSGDVFLVVEVIADCEPSDVQDLGGVLATYMGFDAEPLEKSASHLERSALSGISLAFPGSLPPNLRQIGGGVCFAIDPVSSKQIFHVHPMISGSISQQIGLSPNDAKTASGFTRALHDSQELESVARLLHQSSLQSGNSLLRFMAAWSALEILFNKLAVIYKPKEEVPKVDGGAVVFRFMVMAEALDPAGASEDIEHFSELKKLRDKYMHGMKLAIEDLPTDQARELVRKYLRLHIERI